MQTLHLHIDANSFVGHNAPTSTFGHNNQLEYKVYLPQFATSFPHYNPLNGTVSLQRLQNLNASQISGVDFPITIHEI